MPCKHTVVAAGSLVVLLCAMATLDAGAPASAQEAEADKQSFKLIASAPLIAATDPANHNLTCYLTNVGDDPVKLKSLRLVDGAGTQLARDYDTCGKSLNGRKSCGIGWNYRGLYVGVHCEAMVGPSRSIRGRLELRKGGAVESAAALR